MCVSVCVCVLCVCVLKLRLHWEVALNSLYSIHQIFTEYLLDAFGSVGEVMVRWNPFPSS